MPDRPAPPWRGLTLAAVAIGLVVLIVLLGVLSSPPRSVVSTDRLGADQGEQVADYLARSRDSLAGPDQDAHWALVSFTEPLTPQQVPDHSGGMRIAQVLHRVPIPRVQTPMVAVAVPEGDAAAVASATDAAWLLPRPTDDRTAHIITVAAARLRAGCACTVGLVVRGPLTALRNLATQHRIRAVEALPADAIAGSFGVVPLLPEYVDVVSPGPNDGPVPER